MKNADEAKNYLTEETNENELMDKKHKNAFTALNYIEHLLFLPSVLTGFVSIFTFGFLFGIPIGIASSGVGLEIFAITAGIKKYKSIPKKNRK